MAGEYVKVTTFAVGQGLCELIEIYDEPQEQLIFLALVDCGSTSKVRANKNTYVQNIEEMFAYVIEKANARKRTIGTHYFDMVSISHQDEDHWNLLMELICRMLGIEKGEYFSIQDEQGICTEYIVDIEHGEELRIFTLQEDDSYCTWNYSNKIEDFEENYVDYSYGRFWKEKKREILQNSEGIEVVVKSDCFEGEMTALYYPDKNGATIEYKLQYEEGNITSSLHMENDIATILINGKSSQGEIVGGNLENVLLEFLNKVAFAFPTEFQNIVYDILRINAGITLEEVQGNIREGRPIDKVIHRLYFGGSQYGSKASAFKAKLSNMAREVKNLSWDTGSECGGRIQYDMIMPMYMGVLFSSRALYENLRDRKVRIGIERNRTSLFVMLSCGNNMLFFPGDATVHTMLAFDSIEKNCYFLRDKTVQLLLAPHHGSDVSSADDGASASRSGGYSGLRDFLRMLSPKNMHISIGIKNRHHHPGVNFIEQSICTMKGKMELHEVYQYKEKYVFRDVEKSIETTVVAGEEIEEMVFAEVYRNCEFELNLSAAKANTIKHRTKVSCHTRELPSSQLFI